MRALKMVLVVLASMVTMASSAHAQSKAQDDAVKEARAAIDAANAKFSEAFARGDTKALAAMYTSDAIVFPPDSEMVRGTEAIENFWSATIKSGAQSATLATSDVERSGDMACEVGNVSLKIQAPEKEPMTVTEKYVVVWKRQTDGSWKLHRDIWNSLPATK